MVHPMDMMEEHWGDHDGQNDPPPRFMPLQAQEGDYALFLHKAAVEITFEKKEEGLALIRVIIRWKLKDKLKKHELHTAVLLADRAHSIKSIHPLEQKGGA